MRYLTLPLFAMALGLASADTANAEPRWHKHRPKPPKAAPAQAPELDGNALPAALTLLAGGAVVVMSRRRVTPKVLA